MSPTKTKYKHIYFTESPDKKIWLCRNTKSQKTLAALAYYKPWHRYCIVEFWDDVVFDADCLRDIAHFLDQLNKGD